MTSQAVNIPQWISENEKSFAPPVCNKLMHGKGQLKVMYIGGPNIRKDFHLEEGEEVFYMVKGHMTLRVIEKGKFKDIPIKEGEIFLLPAKIPHSPQRYENTVGLVIERERLKTETDCLRYFVEGTTEILFEKWFYCEDLGVQLIPVIQEYFSSEQHRTGRPIPGTITSNPPWQPDSKRELEKPFSLNYWIMENFQEIKKNGKKRLFNFSYESDVTVYVEGEDSVKDETEIWLWQIEGESEVITKEEIKLKKNDSLLIEGNVPFMLRRHKGAITIAFNMNPKNKK
ncbi:UNVERIFIED_CONTAM: hypothetical protein RMT77_003859 [Armadillidium vulgare]